MSSHDSSDTRDRLIAAAAQVFAEVGFRQATVREICDRAEANVAAVNYHFGDKQGLYDAVFRYAQKCVPPPSIGEDPSAPAEVRLREFIRGFLVKLLAHSDAALHGKIWAREMVDPTPVMDRVVSETIKPHQQLLEELVREMVGNGLSAEQVRLCALSVIGQCLHYRHCCPVLERLFPDLQFSAEFLDRLAEHITDFSLGALEGFRRTQGGETV